MFISVSISILIFIRSCQTTHAISTDHVATHIVHDSQPMLSISLSANEFHSIQIQSTIDSIDKN